MDSKTATVELGQKLSSEMVEELGRLRMITGHQTSLLREALFKIRNLTQYNRDLSTRLSGFEDAIVLVKAGGAGSAGRNGDLTSGRDVTYDIEKHLEEAAYIESNKKAEVERRFMMGDKNAGVSPIAKQPRAPMSEKQKKKISATQKRRHRAKKKATK